MYNKALSLYFIPPYEQFPTFVFSEYNHDFLLILFLYDINVCYYFYSLWCHFSKVILTTGEVITATVKVISATTKEVFATEEVITTTLK